MNCKRPQQLFRCWHLTLGKKWRRDWQIYIGKLRNISVKKKTCYRYCLWVLTRQGISCISVYENHLTALKRGKLNKRMYWQHLKIRLYFPFTVGTHDPLSFIPFIILFCLQVVWRAMQEEFVRQYKYIEDLLQRCYPGAQISLDFTIANILEYFSDIAIQH